MKKTINLRLIGKETNNQKSELKVLPKAGMNPIFIAAITIIIISAIITFIKVRRLSGIK